MEDRAVLWARYLESRSKEDRNALAESYMPLAMAAAAATPNPMWPVVDEDDLASDAAEGLLDALARFDPEAGVKFETYAGYRVRGAARDGVRRMDPVPRGFRDSARLLADALERTEGGGPPPEEVERWRMEAHASAKAASIEAMEDAGNGWRGPEAGNPPEEAALARERAGMLARAEAGLLDSERDVVDGLYYRGEREADVARRRGVSASRVSQIHRRALGKLKKALLEAGYEAS